MMGRSHADARLECGHAKSLRCLFGIFALICSWVAANAATLTVDEAGRLRGFDEARRRRGLDRIDGEPRSAATCRKWRHQRTQRERHHFRPIGRRVAFPLRTKKAHEEGAQPIP